MFDCLTTKGDMALFKDYEPAAWQKTLATQKAREKFLANRGLVLLPNVLTFSDHLPAIL